MRIPSNHTEAEVVEIIEKVSKRLAPKFRFGYHSVEDIQQQAALYAWEGLAKYDEERPLENFLWVHVHNQLYNHKRKHCGRPDEPCLKCPLNAYVNGKCTAYDSRMDCKYYASWVSRNEIKRSLLSTSESVESYAEDSAEDNYVKQELFKLVDTRMPVQHRELWIKYSNNLKLPKHKRDEIETIIKDILQENNFES
jgi:DNA-directed RNA polymerase specialized sigma24 family protein